MPLTLISRALIFIALFWAAPASAQEFGRNIQIIVETRQSGYQTQGISESRTTSTQKQFVVVTEGMEGKVFVGHKVPFASYFRQFLTTEGLLATDVNWEFRDVGTSLIVRARVVGDNQIEVTLTPEVSYATQDGLGRIAVAVQTLSTSVRVPSGQPFEIGGNVSNSEFESNFYRSQSGQALQVVLTPTIL